MARQAEAERERRAKIIAAEGELQASQKLGEAADVINRSPGALQLRQLQTMVEISAENTSTIIFPIPIEIMGAISALTTHLGGDPDPPIIPPAPVVDETELRLDRVEDDQRPADVEIPPVDLRRARAPAAADGPARICPRRPRPPRRRRPPDQRVRVSPSRAMVTSSPGGARSPRRSTSSSTRTGLWWNRTSFRTPAFSARR